MPVAPPLAAADACAGRLGAGSAPLGGRGRIWSGAPIDLVGTGVGRLGRGLASVLGWHYRPRSHAGRRCMATLGALGMRRGWLFGACCATHPCGRALAHLVDAFSPP